MEGKVPLWLVAVYTAARQLEIIWNLNQKNSEKVPLWLVAVYTAARQLEIIWNLNQKNSDNNYETSNAERWTFYGEKRQAFSFADHELQYHIMSLIYYSLQVAFKWYMTTEKYD